MSRRQVCEKKALQIPADRDHRKPTPSMPLYSPQHFPLHGGVWTCQPFLSQQQGLPCPALTPASFPAPGHWLSDLALFWCDSTGNPNPQTSQQQGSTQHYGSAWNKSGARSLFVRAAALAVQCKTENRRMQI